MFRGGILLVFLLYFLQITVLANSYVIHANDPVYLELSFFSPIPKGGDTIFIENTRVKSITFIDLSGDEDQPIVITNQQGQVNINDPDSWSALLFKNCHFIKLIGNGYTESHYGFKLSAKYSGVNIGQNSSDFEIAFIEIDHNGFVGIQVKDDYGGDPPFPLPEFRKLVIHDCFIKNVTEGMYLGETKSPGLTFRYVRIFNNVIMNTGREGMQLANMVEDVKVFNNLVSGSGHDLLYGQGNNIQIGDNTVADIYNNILEGAPDYGVIVFGMGHINIYSNYIAKNKGIFIDNRKFTNHLATIEIRNNYFTGIISDAVVLNYNELNKIILANNQFDPSLAFYHSNCPNCSNVNITANINSMVPKLEFTISNNGVFHQALINDIRYLNFGPVSKQEFSFNSWPEFNNLHDIFVNSGSTIDDTIVAHVHDNDRIEMHFEQMPSFVNVNEIENGKVALYIDARGQEIGRHQILVTATDKSDEVHITETFSVVVKDALNEIPQIFINDFYQVTILEKSTIPFSVFDPNGDNLEVSLLNAPDFLHLVKQSANEYAVALQPGFIDVGTYKMKIRIQDNYSGLIEKKIIIQVLPKELEAGTVLYRINFGGPELFDEPINWLAGNGSLETFSDQWLPCTGSYSWEGKNYSGVPDSLFGPYVYAKPDSQTIRFNFICAPQKYLVKLYLTERQADFDSLGISSFQVLAENKIVLEKVLINNSLINKSKVERFSVNVYDSVLNLKFVPIKNFVKIYGLEISVAFPFNINNDNNTPAIFPNPFSDYFYIINDENNPVREWRIYNVIGHLIAKGVPSVSNISFIKVNTQMLLQGNYYISLETPLNRKMHKVIK